MDKRTGRTGRPLRMWLVAVMIPVALLTLSAPAVAEAPSARYLAQESGRIPKQQRTPLDRLTGAAAIVSIGIVGVAGVYIYRLIRKGL